MKFFIFLIFVLTACHPTSKAIKTTQQAPMATSLSAPTQLEHSVYFELNSDAIKNIDVIKKNADWLKANTDKVVILAGHCDETGSDEYNMLLGDRRARSVMKSLMDEGVKENQLIILSYGKKQSPITNNNEKGRESKRRVDFVLR